MFLFPHIECPNLELLIAVGKFRNSAGFVVLAHSFVGGRFVFDEVYDFPIVCVVHFAVVSSVLVGVSFELSDHLVQILNLPCHC